MNDANTDHRLRITRTDDLRHAFIQFNTHRVCDALLKVVNDEDREVRLLLNERLEAGHHSVSFYFGNLSGTYNIRLVINTLDAIDIETQQIKID